MNRALIFLVSLVASMAVVSPAFAGADMLLCRENTCIMFYDVDHVVYNSIYYGDGTIDSILDTFPDVRGLAAQNVSDSDFFSIQGTQVFPGSRFYF